MTVEQPPALIASNKPNAIPQFRIASTPTMENDYRNSTTQLLKPRPLSPGGARDLCDAQAVDHPRFAIRRLERASATRSRLMTF
jgi:hypothetical protein